MVAGQRTEAERLGLAFGDRTMTYNSRRAQVLGKWAAGQGRGPAFRNAVYEMYFSQCRNIADTAVLAEIAQTAGLDPRAAVGALTDSRYADQVDADWQRSVAKGVRAVPTLAAGGRMLTGAYPTDTIRDFIRGAAS